MAKDGTIGGLWEAAESCFKQAQLALDDWHIYIEDFEVQDDGTLELVTGSSIHAFSSMHMVALRAPGLPIELAYFAS